jgi:hypothetical protein
MKYLPMNQWHSHLLASTQDIAPGKTARFAYTFTAPMMKHSLAFGNYAPTTHSVITLPLPTSA